MYWIIHMTETDGGIALWPCKNGKEVETYLKVMNMHPGDYAIIEGLKIKSFSNTSFDYKSLKGK